MLIQILIDERYPDYEIKTDCPYNCMKHEVPVETVARWQAARSAFMATQDEIYDLVKKESTQKTTG